MDEYGVSFINSGGYSSIPGFDKSQSGDNTSTVFGRIARFISNLNCCTSKADDQPLRLDAPDNLETLGIPDPSGSLSGRDISVNSPYSDVAKTRYLHAGVPEPQYDDEGYKYEDW